MIIGNPEEENKRKSGKNMRKNESSILSQKVIGKMMRMAKLIANDNNPCYSRKVGCVITDSDGIILGTGYNGPGRKTPHCDSQEYIRDILWPKLTKEEQDTLLKKGEEHNYSTNNKRYLTAPYSKQELVSRQLANCKTCPRRFFGYGPGVRSELCSCGHGEVNAIVNSNGSVAGGILFGYCVTSCQSCTTYVINSRIKEVHFLDGEEYQKGVWKQYEYAKIPVFLYKESDFQ